MFFFVGVFLVFSPPKKKTLVSSEHPQNAPSSFFFVPLVTAWQVGDGVHRRFFFLFAFFFFCFPFFCFAFPFAVVCLLVFVFLRVVKG